MAWRNICTRRSRCKIAFTTCTSCWLWLEEEDIDKEEGLVFETDAVDAVVVCCCGCPLLLPRILFRVAASIVGLGGGAPKVMLLVDRSLSLGLADGG